MRVDGAADFPGIRKEPDQIQQAVEARGFDVVLRYEGYWPFGDS
jgi:hypothetical protein